MKTALLALALSVTTAAAQTSPSPGPILDDLVQTHYIREVALSPDATRVAWAEAIFDKGRDTGRTAVYADVHRRQDQADAARRGIRDRVVARRPSRLAWIDKQLERRDDRRRRRGR